MNVVVARAEAADLGACLEIRRRVFIEEQSVDAGLEVDGRDPHCEHWIARLDGVPIGTARAREIEAGVAKVERVAVLAVHRRRGVGHAIMDRLEADLAAGGVRETVLASQRSAERFYATRGYVAEGAPFIEADIEHVFMRKPLAAPPGQTG